jgi:4-hydroxy-4-methyl-2-oxoglutarate aldolase
MSQSSIMLSANLRESLLLLSTPLLADAKVRAGLPESHLDAGIRPVVPYSRMVGTAVPVRLEVAHDEASADLTLLSRAYESGGSTSYPIMVIQVPPELHGYGVFGEGSAIFARARGFVGALVEGAARDSHDLRALAFPTFSRVIAPGNIHGKATAVALNEPVVIGGKTVFPGDVIMADNDAVVVIRPAELEQIVSRAQAIRIWEARVHESLADGHDHKAAIKMAGPMP